MPGVASVQRISSRFTSFRNSSPRSFHSGAFFCSVHQQGKNLRFITKNTASIRPPAARQPSPAIGAIRLPFLNWRRPARMPPGPACVRLRPASSLAVRERAVASLTTGRKVSRIRADSGKDRPQLERFVRPWAWCGNIPFQILPLFARMSYHAPRAGHWSLLKRATCRSLQVPRFSTSRQGTPRYARESGIFSLGPTMLRV
ncbi:hypothetical protein Alfi_0179 [Alistipes finegoldii DSM 17242]|uniref:Uncharacterized protein n=1 Tax=Alistipes finegoldii (strain DSM 17242 / JCM 16770 / CCUG 46020 / CIP 107999 / KCTC 15236 / AHN 2437) TaxID=679935 RepID=I3YHX1_ALIFI|nr:hypothetical protein Alfi_0179 [Alistipes finegoldii DSM 17242]